MNHNAFQQLKNDYLNVPIPENLDFIVRSAVNKALEADTPSKPLTRLSKPVWISAAVAASLLLLTINLNTNQAFADDLSKIPIVGGLVKILTLKTYTHHDENYQAHIDVPQVSGFKNKDLEAGLNQKYLEESKKLYTTFEKDIAGMKKLGVGHKAVDGGYVVKVNSDELLVIERWVVQTEASGYETVKYDTLDQKGHLLITLPSLFKDQSYVPLISDNIKAQMLDQMKKDSNKYYFVKGAPNVMENDLFDQIDGNQSFYINKDHQLVISFNEYTVAPGYMGVTEFVIPSELLSKILVSSQYIH